jgi:hypothetical protein
MRISPETRAMILEDLKVPGADISRVSRHYGVPLRILRDMATETPVPTSVSGSLETNGGFGRPELIRFTLSRTLAGMPWPIEDQGAIDAARINYDAGFLEMCQGRDGNWLILYAIPRREVAVRASKYFVRRDGYYYES